MNIALIVISILCIFLDRLCSRWQKSESESLGKAGIIVLRIILWGVILSLLGSACVLIIQPR